jgi:hypothetical protein
MIESAAVMAILLEILYNGNALYLQLPDRRRRVKLRVCVIGERGFAQLHYLGNFLSLLRWRK